MILDGQERFVISSQGWVERGGIFIRRNIQTSEISSFNVADAAYLRLYAVDSDRFMAVGPATDHASLTLSIRQFDNPGTAIWSMAVKPTDQRVFGNAAAFAGARRHHLATFKHGDGYVFRLISIRADGAGVTLGELPWYTQDAYDLGYQGLTDVVQIPGTNLVMVSVQRSSIVVVHDPKAGSDVARLNLADRGGNPILSVVGNELWTVDYDTFVRVDLATRRVMTSALVQPSRPYADSTIKGMMRQFAGDLSIWTAGQKVAIPRPFSGDVAIVDPIKGRMESTVTLGNQPLSCVVTKMGRIIARDWKSGGWLEGNIQA